MQIGTKIGFLLMIVTLLTACGGSSGGTTTTDAATEGLAAAKNAQIIKE